MPLKARLVFVQLQSRSTRIYPPITHEFGRRTFNLNSRYAGACMLYLGAIEPQPTGAPSLNVYCESMLDWVEQIGSIEKLETGADGK